MTISLESQFKDQAFCTFERGQKPCFADFLEPNEYCPEAITPHLQLAEKGLHVTTGTERSFFHLLFSEESRCEGILVRDINPKVKAYNDFNTLMLRLCQERATYVALTDPVDIDSEEYQERFKEIQGRLKLSVIPQEAKGYYLKNLNDFAKIYFESGQGWKHHRFFQDHFKACRYDLKEDQYQKLKRYADSGNIVSTIGCINDLKFLAGKTISVVDTSNICDYTFIDLKFEGPFSPRVIRSVVKGEAALYSSFKYSPLNDTERAEIEEASLGRRRITRLSEQIETPDPFNDSKWPVYGPWLLSISKSHLIKTNSTAI